MLPKIEVRRPSIPELTLPTDSLKLVLRGVNAGASGLNDGPEDEKLNSLCPGVKTGAATLILPFELAIELLLKWLEDAETGIGGAE
jgi:hypothetical protein